MTRFLEKVNLWIQRHEARSVEPGLPPIVRACAFDGRPIRGIGYIHKGVWYCAMGCASLQVAREASGPAKRPS